MDIDYYGWDDDWDEYDEEAWEDYVREEEEMNSWLYDDEDYTTPYDDWLASLNPIHRWLHLKWNWLRWQIGERIYQIKVRLGLITEETIPF